MSPTRTPYRLYTTGFHPASAGVAFVGKGQTCGLHGMYEAIATL